MSFFFSVLCVFHLWKKAEHRKTKTPFLSLSLTSTTGSVGVHHDAHGPSDRRGVRCKGIGQLRRLEGPQTCGLVPPDGVVVGVDLSEAAHHVELVGGSPVILVLVMGGAGGGGGAVVGAGLVGWLVGLVVVVGVLKKERGEVS